MGALPYQGLLRQLALVVASAAELVRIHVEHQRRPAVVRGHREGHRRSGHRVPHGCLRVLQLLLDVGEGRSATGYAPADQAVLEGAPRPDAGAAGVAVVAGGGQRQAARPSLGAGGVHGLRGGQVAGPAAAVQADAAVGLAQRPDLRGRVDLAGEQQLDVARELPGAVALDAAQVHVHQAARDLRGVRLPRPRGHQRSRRPGAELGLADGGVLVHHLRLTLPALTLSP